MPAYGQPLDPISVFFLTKMLSLGVVAMISTDRSHVRLLSPHLPAIFVKIPFFDHFHHFLPFLPAYEQTLCPISACVDKNNFTGRCCNDICKERATLGYYHPIFLPFAWKCNFLDIFGHFSLFVPAHGWPLNPTSTFIDKNVITGCCCNDICKERATLGYYQPIFPPFAWKCNF